MKRTNRIFKSKKEVVCERISGGTGEKVVTVAATELAIPKSQTNSIQ